VNFVFGQEFAMFVSTCLALETASALLSA